MYLVIKNTQFNVRDKTQLSKIKEKVYVNSSTTRSESYTSRVRDISDFIKIYNVMEKYMTSHLNDVIVGQHVLSHTQYVSY